MRLYPLDITLFYFRYRKITAKVQKNLCICKKNAIFARFLYYSEKKNLILMKEISTKKLIETIIEGIQNRKGQKIVTIDLRKIQEAPVEYMVIAEGNSNTQVSAIANEVDDFVRTTTHVHPLAKAGEENAEWIAMDYGSVFVHIMQREPRAYYDIEHLWADGKITEIEDVL